MSQETQIEINVLTSLSQISETEWDRCACPEALGRPPIDPFTTHRFLKALEDS
ncbi:MAG TPA: GNAT family N-acetyltransferase, partial [Planktomarina temperata]|nr:GNAT family N-acetyltransferase [Planktomarina temperata]